MATINKIIGRLGHIADKSTLMKTMSLWPPLFGAGIRVNYVAKDFKKVEVSMKLHFWNANYVGTQYGEKLQKVVDC